MNQSTIYVRKDRMWVQFLFPIAESKNGEVAFDSF